MASLGWLQSSPLQQLDGFCQLVTMKPFCNDSHLVPLSCLSHRICPCGMQAFPEVTFASQRGRDQPAPGERPRRVGCGGDLGEAPGTQQYRQRALLSGV